jgi:hypothetical protein
MGKPKMAREHDILTSVIFSLPIGLPRKKSQVQYCPALQMVTDYFTKPLQGGLFYKFRDQILGLAPMETIHGDQRSVLKSNPASTGSQQSTSKGLARCDVRKQLKVAPSQRTWAEVARLNVKPASNRMIRLQQLAA